MKFQRRMRFVGLWPLIGCWLLSGCGWHLQGERHLAASLSPLYVQWSDPHSEFALALQSALRGSGVVLAAAPAAARLTLTIDDEQTGHHVSIVSALNEPQQYEVFYRVTWRVAQASQLRPGQSGGPFTIGLSRTMNYDKTAALAMQRREQTLARRLAEDVADQVLFKLSLVTAAP